MYRILAPRSEKPSMCAANLGFLVQDISAVYSADVLFLREGLVT